MERKKTCSIRREMFKGYLLSHIGSTVSAKAAERYSRRWRFEGHVKSEMTMEEEVLECVRAKIYQRAHQEVPYNVELRMERLEEGPERMAVDVVIEVKTRSHQNLLNGSAGQHIKQWAARDLAKRFGKEVALKMRATLN